MKQDALCRMPFEEIARLIETKTVSPVEVTQHILDRIERVNQPLNAFMTITADAALNAARASEQRIANGEYRGALDGVPIAHKDLLATKGVRTTAGSKILGDWMPDYDATVVRLLADAGAVSVGKLGLHEFAFGTTSDNAHYGAIHNPWDLERIPGGSSGGSGVATAACLAFATIGSDTGGSIRIPASECGVVGVMPTYGRVSLYGAVPLATSFDHLGPLTRTVRDAAIVLQAISGHDPLDPTTARQPVPDFLDGIERGPTGLRIGVPKHHFWEQLNPEIEASVRAAISALEAAGASVREVDFPLAEQYTNHTGPIIIKEAAGYHAPNFPSRRDEYGPQVAATLDAGIQVSDAIYATAIAVMHGARAGAADAVLDGVDVLAVPTMPEPPPTIEQIRSGFHDIRRTVFTSLLDLTGQPVVTVPCGFAGSMPTGISFVARQWNEASALWAARAWEQIRGPFPLPDVG